MANILRVLKSNVISRIVLGAMALVLIAIGVGTLLNGAFNYRNWWGGIVFAPFAILIGTGLLFVVILRPKAFVETTKKRGRIRGWPTGRARYYRDRD